MRLISVDEVEQYLARIAMKVGKWKSIVDISDNQRAKRTWINHQAPKDELLNFCYHIVHWLPKGQWKIFQIDNSTGWMDPVEASWIGGLLFGANSECTINDLSRRAILLEYGHSAVADQNTELLLANLVYVFLLFEFHGYIVSSGSDAGQILGVQDGFIYFSSLEYALKDAKEILESYNENPKKAPPWILDIVATAQERELGM